jgi:signal transduction histidine kinase
VSHAAVPDIGLIPGPTSAAEAALRLIAHHLGAAAVHLYRASGGQQHLVAAAGVPFAALPLLADALGSEPTALDVSAVVEGVHLAAGQCAGALSLLVLGLDGVALDSAWLAAFADAMMLVHLVAGSPEGPPAEASEDFRGRLLHRVATHTGTFDERLAIGLAGLADTLGLDAAAFARIDEGTWTPESIVDPLGLLPAVPTPVADLPCAITATADGPVAIDGLGDGRGAYLGAPVFAGGRTVGTLVAVGRAARAAPFSEDDRALVESLARWVGSAVGGREAARRLADREAALAAFVDRAPVAMGLTTLAGDGAVRFVSVNAAAARLIGIEADALAGRLAAEVGIDGYAGRLWAAGTRRALACDVGTSLPPILLALETPAGTRSIEATLTRLDVHDTDGHLAPCVSFVAEDVTNREAGLRVASERRHLAEAAAVEQASLFERLHRDVRTPLTTILGYAELLGPDLAEGEPEQIRDVITRSTHQLLATLDAAVALAEAVRVSIALVPVDAAAVVRDAVRTAAAAAREAGVEISYEAAVTRVPLLMDPALVGRVVRAIVDEATAVPGARHVDTRLTDDGSRLVFDVGVRDSVAADAATGLPPASVDRLVERLVERLGGSVDVPAGPLWRRTVRLPRHAAVVVDLPPEAIPPDVLLFASPVGVAEAYEAPAMLRPDMLLPDGLFGDPLGDPFGALDGPIGAEHPFADLAHSGWTSAESAA